MSCATGTPKLEAEVSCKALVLLTANVSFRESVSDLHTSSCG